MLLPGAQPCQANARVPRHAILRREGGICAFLIRL